MIGTVIKVKVGWVGVARLRVGLCRVTLPQASFVSALTLLGNDLQQMSPDSAVFGDLPERLRRYFEGEPIAFPDELDLSSASPFRQAAWQATRAIPLGETRSYRWVAEQIGNPKASRAVGQALAVNPLAILIPCHRVIGSDGSLVGFGGGLGMKRWLLVGESSSSKFRSGE